MVSLEELAQQGGHCAALTETGKTRGTEVWKKPNYECYLCEVCDQNIVVYFLSSEKTSIYDQRIDGPEKLLGHTRSSKSH